MSKHMSVWTLKKMPLTEVVNFISDNSTTGFQAKMAGMPEAEYSRLSEDEWKERLSQSISQMDEQSYTDYLLEIVDE